MITRDMVQGFIDALKATDNLDHLEKKVKTWLETHHTYPTSGTTLNKILDDLGSYQK